jgi:hypothetical protein
VFYFSSSIRLVSPVCHPKRDRDIRLNKVMVTTGSTPGYGAMFNTRVRSREEILTDIRRLELRLDSDYPGEFDRLCSYISDLNEELRESRDGKA